MEPGFCNRMFLVRTGEACRLSGRGNAGWVAGLPPIRIYVSFGVDLVAALPNPAAKRDILKSPAGVGQALPIGVPESIMDLRLELCIGPINTSVKTPLLSMRCCQAPRQQAIYCSVAVIPIVPQARSAALMPGWRRRKTV